MITEKDWSPQYKSKHLSALRRVLKECWRLGLMDGEDYLRAVDLPPIPGDRVRVGQHLDTPLVSEAITKIKENGTHRDIRDAAIVTLLLCTGIRRAELAALSRGDYTVQAIKVTGKGDRQRIVPLPILARMALDEWVAVRGDADGALFIPIGRHHFLTEKPNYSHLTGETIRLIVRRTLEATPHDFRRTLIGSLLSANVDPSIIMKITGHRSVRTMLSYDRRNHDLAASALEDLFPLAAE